MAVVSAHDSSRSLEYKREDLRMSIIRNPNNLLGNVSTHRESRWVYEESSKQIKPKMIDYNEGFHKTFDEIITNALDHQKRQNQQIEQLQKIKLGQMSATHILHMGRSFRPVTQIDVVIDPANGVVSVRNDGNGIPIDIHPEYKIYVPQLIFGELLAGSNSADGVKRKWGGMNQMGAKLTNIFSRVFEVETLDHEKNMLYVQRFSNRLAKVDAPQIKQVAASAAPYTKITYQIEPSAFKDAEDRQYELPSQLFPPDAVQYMYRRVLDIAALSGESTPAVQVTFNGQKITNPRNLLQYSNLYIGPASSRKRITFQSPPDWNVIVSTSDESKDEFEQISFVNGVFTGYEVGSHVDHIISQITEVLSKEFSSSDLPISQAQVKQHLWVMVDATITNPEFSDQKKTKLITRPAKFSSRCPIAEAEIKKLATTLKLKPRVIASAREQQDRKLQRESRLSARQRLSNPKLVPALDEGRVPCTLAIAEGDAACTSVTQAISNLPEAQRRSMGVFPIRGKLLNTRDHSQLKISQNKEVQLIMQTMGLETKMDYSIDANYRKLRYNSILIMADADHDGYHIQGLIFNFIHSMWPQLLKRPGFFKTLATPIVKASPGSKKAGAAPINFYSLTEFKRWIADSSTKPHLYNIKYYKGLGTYKRDEAKLWFKEGKIIRFMPDTGLIVPAEGSEPINPTDMMLLLAFSKKKIWNKRNMSDFRKDWLLSYKPGSDDVGVDPTITEITYANQLQQRYLPAAVYNTERSVPSLVDGLKPSQRKVLAAAFKENLTERTTVKVSAFSGDVTKNFAYHHGDAALHGTIINMAQDFPGSNNLNLLWPDGQFGTRMGDTDVKSSIGGDAASPRYIFTYLNPLSRLLFNAKDFPNLQMLEDDGKQIEPRYYVPILPNILINGTDGIGTGFSSQIPQHNPQELIDCIRVMLRKSYPDDPYLAKKGLKDLPDYLTPWFRGFKGDVRKLSPNKTIVYGKFHWEQPNRLVITELPIGSTMAMSFNSFKNFLEELIKPNDEPNNSKKAAIAAPDNNPIQRLKKKLNQQKVDYLKQLLQALNLHADAIPKKLTKSDTIETLIKYLSPAQTQELLQMLPDKKSTNSGSHKLLPTAEELDEEEESASTVLDGEDKSMDDEPSAIDPLVAEWAQQNIQNIIHDLSNPSGPRFIIEIKPDHIRDLCDYPARVYNMFKLALTISTNNMYLFDYQGQIKNYPTTMHILTEFAQVRMHYYNLRYSRILEELKYEVSKSSSKARFVEAVLNNSFEITDAKTKRPLSLEQWEQRLASHTPSFPKLCPNFDEHFSQDNSRASYDYLTHMEIRSLTADNLQRLQNQRDEYLNRLKQHESMKPYQLWWDDLDEFEKEWQKYAVQETTC